MLLPIGLFRLEGQVMFNIRLPDSESEGIVSFREAADSPLKLESNNIKNTTTTKKW